MFGGIGFPEKSVVTNEDFQRLPCLLAITGQAFSGIGGTSRTTQLSARPQSIVLVFAQPTAIIRLSWLSAMALPSRRHALTSPHCHALTMSFRQPLQPWWLSEPLPKTSHGWRCKLVHVVVPSCSSRHSRMSYSKIPQPHSTAPCNNGTPCTSEMGLEGLMMALLLS